MLFMFDIGRTLLDCEKHPINQIMEDIHITEDKKDILKKIIFTMDYGRDVSGLIRNIEFNCEKSFNVADKIAFMNILKLQEYLSFPMQGSKEFTDKILNDNFEYCIISNIWRPFYYAFKSHFPKFNANAKQWFLSFEMGCRKPYGEFYKKVFDTLNFDKNKLCIIGDNWKNDIAPALRNGCKAIWFNHQNKELLGTHDNLYVTTNYDGIYGFMNTLQGRN